MVKIRGDFKKCLYEDFTVSRKYSVKLKDRNKLKEGEKISSVSDSMFKAMFYNEKRLKYSTKLLSYILDVEYENLLNNIKLAKKELDKEKESNKGERCDYVADINGSYVNIEMNSNDTEYLMERNIEYAFKLFNSTNKIGPIYNYKQVIQINLNNFSFEGLDDVMYIEEVGNELYRKTNKLIIIEIFLPNIYKKCYNQGIERLSEMERFILSMIEDDIDRAKSYALRDEIMNEFIEESKEVSFNGGFGEAYDKEWATRDQGLREGYEDGVLEGIEIGEKNKRLEIAKNMLKDKIDIETISKYTKLTTEEIENL